MTCDLSAARFSNLKAEYNLVDGGYLSARCRELGEHRHDIYAQHVVPTRISPRHRP